MKSSWAAWLLIFSLVAAVPANADEKPQSPTQPHSASQPNIDDLTARVTLGGKDSKAIIEDLKNCIDKCAPGDQEKARRLLNFVEHPLDSREEIQNSYRFLKDLYKGELKKFAAAPGEQTRWLAALFALSSTMYLADMKDEAAKLRRETIDQSIELVKKFPESADAHRNLAFELTYPNIDPSHNMTSGEMEAGLHEYVACLKLSKHEPRCRKPYDLLVKSYTHPRCAEGQINQDFATYIGSDKEEGPFSKKMDADAGTIYVDPSPVIISKNVAKLSQDLDESFHETYLSIDLDNDGTTHWAAATEKNVGRYGVIAVGDKVLLAPLIREKISFGRMRLTLGTAEKAKTTQKLFKNLCGKIDKPKLPKDLKI